MQELKVDRKALLAGPKGTNIPAILWYWSLHASCIGKKTCLCVTYSKDHILLSDFAAKCSKPNSDLCVSLHDLLGMENDHRSLRVKPSKEKGLWLSQKSITILSADETDPFHAVSALFEWIQKPILTTPSLQMLVAFWGITAADFKRFRDSSV